MPDNITRIFMAAGGLASFAGLAALLRSGKPLTVRNVSAAMLNSGILGLAVALLWFTKFCHDLTYLIGMSVLAGIGGVTLIDFAVQIIRGKLGVKIEVSNGK